MISTYEHNYGADADGNRGISFWEYELEESDEPEILEQLVEMQDEYYNEKTQEVDWPKTLSITLVSDHTGEVVDFDINPRDYI